MTNINAVEKMAELMQQMEESSPRVAALQYCLTQLEARCAALAAENAGLKAANAEGCKWDGEQWVGISIETPATDAFLAEVRAQAHKEGAHFVANRMLAAWDAGFIDDTAKNAADIARMILTSTEFMADAPEGDFDRSFADGVLEDIAAQLRQEAAQ
ncbi:ead/Ea22-like family protein [Enterobacter cloacae complex sp. 379A2]|uniref:ead/Ea22-like family protein n=1 Tax=Enterobacter cloacae complex sp. 379A2 TaxID=3395856 RepID=UPI003CED3EAF